ncbi:MAG: hypothetical protein ACTSWN_15585, partial [Promethearchaeota archaeon]
MVRTFRERIIRVFERQPIERIVFQPRIMYWFNGNRVYTPLHRHDGILHDQTIPKEFFGLDSLEVHQALDASIRYCGETLSLGIFGNQLKKNNQIKTKVSRSQDGEVVLKHETPVGTIQQKSKGGYTTEHFIKHPEDFEVVKYMVEQTEFVFNQHPFNFAEEIFEETGLGIAQSYYSRSPLMRMILNYAGFENTVILLSRHRKTTLEFMKFLDEWDDKMYDVLVSCPVRILNFGENIDGNLVSPRYFKQFLVPYYKKRVKQ